MGAILDLIGSYIFKAAMIGIILATSLSLNEVMTKKAQSTNLEKTMNVSMSVFEWDLRNLGYNYFSGSPVIVASSTDLQFHSDVHNDGSTEVVRWFVTTEFVTIAESTVVRYNVKRTINGGGEYTVFRRLRTWQMTYLTGSGAETTTPAAVRGVRVKVVAESPFIINGEILTAQRQITLYPANLSF
jgi:hypothetical protein